jgi:hypothetical protein
MVFYEGCAAVYSRDGAKLIITDTQEELGFFEANNRDFEYLPTLRERAEAWAEPYWLFFKSLL